MNINEGVVFYFIRVYFLDLELDNFKDKLDSN